MMKTSNNRQFTHRLATENDIDSIAKLMHLSIEENMRQFLSSEQIVAVRETMGVDMTLITDRTYFVIEAKGNTEKAILVGCGGWGKRKTLYGGDQTLGRDDSLSDTNLDAARIRAMYTHPNWTRSGIGSLLLSLGEAAAKQAGFKTIELGSTIPGEPFYLAKGYCEIERTTQFAANGSESVVIKMTKEL